MEPDPRRNGTPTGGMLLASNGQFLGSAAGSILEAHAAMDLLNSTMVAELLTWRIEPGYIDARGQSRSIDPTAAQTLAQSLAEGGIKNGRGAGVAALRRHEQRCINVSDRGPFGWKLSDVRGPIASGETELTIALPADLPIGSYRLAIDSAEGERNESLVLVAPEIAYQPPLFRAGGRAWVPMVQLYAVRSTRNWGHGDFGDLKRLLQIASNTGAAGIGLNPLHALPPGQASAYSPSSRIFLNSLYIDIDAIDEFPGIDACGLAEDVARLRSSEIIDYHAVHLVKEKALRAAYIAFRDGATPKRRKDFDAFRQRVGASLERFATFEVLRERYGYPWQEWPVEWHDCTRALDEHKAGELGDIGFPAFVQWIADAQLRRCVRLARRLALPLGLYLDVAVGVDGGGADVWAAPDLLCRNLFIGAPPDIYNPQGQNWGLAPLHPQALIDSDFSLFRQTLRSVMQYAGAIRIDHALGLNRLYLIPAGASGADGGYVGLPFAAMLAVVAQESADSHCLVIGEDLGTIPEGAREALNEWGIWSYRVALFEREHGGAFRRPEHYVEKAIVTFNTHDLPTFAGWESLHDLKVKGELGLDPGETYEERHDAINAMRATLGEQGLAPDLAFLDVMRYLARTRSRLLTVAMEDILGLVDQPNVPGTVTEHPNWRRRLPLDIEEIAEHATLAGVADVMTAEHRRCAKKLTSS